MNVYDYKLKQRILNLSNAVCKRRDGSLCNELLLYLSDSFAKTNSYVNYKKDNTLIRKAKNMIHYNLENVLKLDDICKELDISKSKFIRLFKANVVISPYQYFLNCKVECAKQIIEKNKDIYSAVAECGFVDLTHLNKYFKSIFGLTAFEYM